MLSREKLVAFDKRWNIIGDENYMAEYKKFRQRIFNFLSDIDDHVTTEGIEQFCQIIGIAEEWETDFSGQNQFSRNIITVLQNEKREKHFYRLLEIIFALPIKTSSGFDDRIEYSRDLLLGRLREAIDWSNVNLAMTAAENGELILYPRGERLLDRELVDRVVSFLPKNAHAHFVEALRFYLGRNHIKSCESIRRGLEEYLRLKLGNSVGLQANIPILTQRLQLHAAQSHIKNEIRNTFKFIDQFFNDNTKHNDGDIDEVENEFVIYQACVLMRYIDKKLLSGGPRPEDV